jgi:CHAD domain-containing protein
LAKQIKPEQSGTKSVRKIIKKHVKDVTNILQSNRKLGEESVHEIRTELKKTRASLRLLRKALNSNSYHRENIHLRDAGKPFTQVRDAKVLLDTLKKLSVHHRNKFDGKPFNNLRVGLRKEYRDSKNKILTDKKNLEKILTKLKKSKQRISNWSIENRGWSKLGAGLTHTFDSANSAFKKAQQKMTPETLHEWRKQVKYLRYQIEILEPLWPRYLKDLAEEDHKLTDYLGNHHDLHILKGKLNQHHEWLADKTSRKELLDAIENQQRTLQEKAFALGTRIFGESKSQFSGRLEKYWKAWKSEGVH